MRRVPHLVKDRLGRIEAESRRIVGSLAARGEAQLGTLIARGRRHDLALRMIALRREAERRGSEAFAHLEAWGEHAIERVGLASRRETVALAGQMRILAARVERLSRREQPAWEADPIPRSGNGVNRVITDNQ